MVEAEPGPSGESHLAIRDPQYLRSVQYATSANLDARARLHERYSTATTDWYDWLTGLVNWASASMVLEVGCGTGTLWSRVPEDASHLEVTLVDLSMSMAQSAERVARERGFSARGIVGDVAQLPFPDGHFDLVIVNHMLYHAPHPASAVRELARVLSPRGTLVAATNGPAHLAELHDIDAAVFGESTRHSSLEAAFGSLSGGPLLTRCLDEVAWHAREDSLRCSNAEDVVAYLTSSPPGSEASDEQRRRLDEEVSQRLADGGGVLIVSKESGAFIARRPIR